MLVRGGGSRRPYALRRREGSEGGEKSPLPVITGVGHEIDETLSDKAADARAATPSAAAERLFPHRADLLASLSHKKRILTAAAENGIKSLGRDLTLLLADGKAALDRALAAADGALGLFSTRLAGGGERAAAGAAERIAALGAALNSLSPLRVFDRGYSLCEKDGQPVGSAAALAAGDALTLRFADGDADAAVTGVRLR